MVSRSHGSAVFLVPDPAPQVDDFLAPAKGTARAAQFTASSEVFGKRVAHGLEAGTDVSFNGHRFGSGCGHRSSLRRRAGPADSFGGRKQEGQNDVPLGRVLLEDVLLGHSKVRRPGCARIDRLQDDIGRMPSGLTGELIAGPCGYSHLRRTTHRVTRLDSHRRT